MKVILAVPAWDAAKGVFVGDRAASTVEVPSPLWIFGYASLVWRPEPSWEGFETRRGHVHGWSRWFAQRSMDHRGTPDSPGLVCTMLPDATGSTLGTVYLVPDERVDDVLASLDFREKGGYSRDIVPVRLDDGSVVQALVYSATAENPNFVKDFVSTDPAALDAAAAIIASSTGPSGPNDEYLLRLADVCPDDVYLQALKARVVKLKL